MKELGFINEEQYTAAKNEQIKITIGKGSIVERKFPYYVDAVLNEAISKYGLTQEEILTRGYRIYTELDQNIQTGLEKVINNKSLFPKGKGDQIVQSGSVLMDPATGGVLALVGGRGEHVFRGFNRATQLRAQPGSTIKPLAVYSPALEEGYTFNSQLVDESISFGDYKPENFSKTYQGKVQLYKALEESLNIPTVWLLNEIGLQKGLESLKSFGLPIEKEDKNLAIALGGMSKGISPQQLANAFSVFPNGGKRHDSHLITKIVGPTGNIIAEHDPKTTKVTSKEIADDMTSMLLNVIESGTGKNAQIPDVQIAGKTGSTQLPFSDINGTKDQWMVGYTPNLVGAIWIGYDKTDREHYLPSSSSGNVVPLFKEIMKESIPHRQKEQFDVLSINDQLAGKVQSREEIKKQAEKIGKELNENAQRLGEKLQEQAPVWKKGLEDAFYSIGKGIDSLIQKFKAQKNSTPQLNCTKIVKTQN